MRVPLSWLRDFNDCSMPPEELARRLTLSGLEVEGIERIGVYSDEVLVGSVLDCKEHPQSPKLRVAEIDLGGGRRATAVTGAPNLPAGARGMKVAAALPGAVLIDAKSEAFALARTVEKEVLGTTSSCVLCSELELGLSPDHSGALLLDDDRASPGQRIRELVRVPADAEADVVLEVAILPNCGRCLSMIGMAREIAALTRTSFKLALDADYIPLDPAAFDVSIADPDRCPRYSGCVVEGVQVQPSPRWLERRLVLAGHKPINCLVDVTNYVMVEMGEPMHAFDLDRLPSRSIRVRRARAGESIATLDQKADGGEAPEPRKLDDSVLLITSGDKPVAVAGVIGGQDSQISSDTRNVLLEAASFDPVAVRKAAALLKVHTESSYRFARGVDPALTTLAIQRATRLLRAVAGARQAGSISDHFPGRRDRPRLVVSIGEIRRALGLELTSEEVTGALSRLGIECERRSDSEEIVVDVPGFRPDIAIAADIAEEVIRVIGFDRVAPRRLDEPLPPQRRNQLWSFREDVRDFLAGAGLQDILSYSLTMPATERKLRAAGAGAAAGGAAGDPPYVRVTNPVSEDRTVMRRTLLAPLLEALARNHRSRERIALFEIGLVWHPELSKGSLPAESWRLGIACSGPVTEASWRDPSPRGFSFFDLKGIVERMVERFHITGATFARVVEDPFHPGIAAELRIDGARAGVIGAVHPSVAAAFDLGKRDVIAGELDLAALLAASKRDHAYTPFLRFPSIPEDLNLVVDSDVPAEAVERALREEAGPLLTEIRLLDVYRGEQIGEGKKSLTYRLVYCAADRSLQQEEVNRLREDMLPRLRHRVGAQIR